MDGIGEKLPHGSYFVTSSFVLKQKKQKFKPPYFLLETRVVDAVAINTFEYEKNVSFLYAFMNDFTNKLGMNIATGNLMIRLFEKKFGESINNYSAYTAAQKIKIPVLVIHDGNDADVPVAAAHHIAEHLANGELMITQGLGHRKILGDSKVIKKIMEFLGL